MGDEVLVNTENLSKGMQVLSYFKMKEHISNIGLMGQAYLKLCDSGSSEVTTEDIKKFDSWNADARSQIERELEIFDLNSINSNIIVEGPINDEPSIYYTKIIKIF